MLETVALAVQNHNQVRNRALSIASFWRRSHLRSLRTRRALHSETHPRNRCLATFRFVYVSFGCGLLESLITLCSQRHEQSDYMPLSTPGKGDKADSAPGASDDDEPAAV